MADPLVISILTAKYARLRGQLQALNEQSRKIAKDMYHVECVIRLFREEFEGRKIKAIRPHKPARWTKSREGMRYAIEVLKTAEKPLTANEIALRAAELAKLPEPDKYGLWAMANAITTGLKRRDGAFVRSDGLRPKRWEIVR